MATYVGFGFPPWAAIDSKGLISISDSAPVGSTTVSVSMTQNGQTYSRSISLNVLAPVAVTKYFTLENAIKPLNSLKLSVSVVMSVSKAVDRQQPLGKLNFALSVAQEFMPGPAQENPLGGLVVDISLTQNVVPFSSGGS